MELYYNDKNGNDKEIIKEIPNKIQELPLVQMKQDSLPILTKPGYFTLPKFSELHKENLEKIEGFTIYNNLGMIEFEGMSDVTNQNLDEIIDINENYVKLFLLLIIFHIFIKLRLKFIQMRYLIMKQGKNQILVKN